MNAPPVTGEIAHRLIDPGRAAELRVLRHLAETAPDLRVPRPSGVRTVDGEDYVRYPRLGDIDLQRALPVDDSTPPRPHGYDRSGGEVEPARLGNALGELGHDLALLHLAPPPAPTEQWTREPAFRLLDSAVPADEYTRRELNFAVRRAEAGGLVTSRHHQALRRVHDELSAITFDRIGFVHFDPHPRNIRLRTTSGRLEFAGIIDFKNAHYWLPELDLAAVRWHLAGLPDSIVGRFLTAYQLNTDRPVSWPTVRLCEVIRLAFVLANARNRDPNWVRWCRRRWDTVLDEYLDPGGGR